RERLIEDLVAGHCGHLPPERTIPMVHAQRLRDAAMAATLERARDALGAAGTLVAAATADAAPLAVLVAGNGHARRDYGVPTLLGAESVLVVGFVEVVPGRDDPAGYEPADAFDFVWFTPRVDEPDPCRQFREQLERLRRPAEAAAVSAPAVPR
ncbi:MAG: ChaN family lipoprotein, partial [Pseudomonadota bacterium]